MNLKKAVFLLLFTPLLGIGQSAKVLICDNLSFQPIPFARLTYIKNGGVKSGMYTNGNGIVTIPKLNSSDKIEIFANGYENKIIKNNDILRDTFFLKKEPIPLNEVVIKSGKKEFIEVGYHHPKKKSIYSSSLGLETVVYIENPYNEDKNVKSFLCKIIRRKQFTTAIRIHFYQVALDSLMPGKEISNKDIIYFIEGNSNALQEFDVESSNIVLPKNGLFVGIEWMGEYDKENKEFVYDKTFDTTIEMNEDLTKPISFTRNRFRNLSWSNLSENLKKYTQIKYKNYPNASFGLKLYKD